MEEVKFGTAFIILVFIIGMFLNRNNLTLVGNLVFSFIYCFFMLILSIPGLICYYLRIESVFIEFFLIVVFFILLYGVVVAVGYTDKLFKKYGLYKKK